MKVKVKSSVIKIELVSRAGTITIVPEKYWIMLADYMGDSDQNRNDHYKHFNPFGKLMWWLAPGYMKREHAWSYINQFSGKLIDFPYFLEDYELY